MLTLPQQARNRLAAAKVLGDADQIEQAKADLEAAKFEAAIRRAVASAPPVSDDKRAELALLLCPALGSQSDGNAA